MIFLYILIFSSLFFSTSCNRKPEQVHTTYENPAMCYEIDDKAPLRYLNPKILEEIKAIPPDLNQLSTNTGHGIH